MESEQLMAAGGSGRRYVQMQSDQPPAVSSFFSFQQAPESGRIFDELPTATIISVLRPDAADFSPMLLSYVIEFQYKQLMGMFVI